MMAQLLSEKEGKPLKLIDTIQRKKDKKELFFSLEFFPPKTFNGATNLMGIIGSFRRECYE